MHGVCWLASMQSFSRFGHIAKEKSMSEPNRNRADVIVLVKAIVNSEVTNGLFIVYPMSEHKVAGFVLFVVFF